MSAPTRRIVDARVEPVVITTIGASDSALMHVRPGALMIARPALPAPVPISHRRPAVWVTGVASALTAIAAGGFTLGWLGWGLSALVSAVSAVAVALAIYAAVLLTSSFAGRSGAHCPGPWHR